MTLSDKLAAYNEQCSKSRLFFARAELKIEVKNGALLPFIPHPYQERLWLLIEEMDRAGTPVRICWLKSRQIGGSTFGAGEQYFRLRHRPGTRALTLAHRDSTTKHILEIAHRFHREANGAVCPVASRTTSKSLEYLSNRSSIEIHTAGSKEATRGGTYSSVHLSEVAFYPDPEAVLVACLNTVPPIPKTLVLIESSANGIGNAFHARWDNAHSGKGDFIPVFTPWFECRDYCTPETDVQREWFAEVQQASWSGDSMELYFRRLQLSQQEAHIVERHRLSPGQIRWRSTALNSVFRGDEPRMRQEFPSIPDEAFIGSGRPFFDMGHLMRHREAVRASPPPVEKGWLQQYRADDHKTGEPFGVVAVRLHVSWDSDDAWRIYERPCAESSYSIGADTAEGLQVDQAVSGSSDFSAAVILDRSTRRIVATFHARIVPELFAEQLNLAGRAYGLPMQTIEFNSSGETVIYILINEHEYPVIYHRRNLLVPGVAEPRPGWKTTKSTRRPLLDRLARAHRSGGIVIPDERLLDEMRTFIENSNGRPQAQAGKFDDMVMAAALALEGDRVMGRVERKERPDTSNDLPDNPMSRMPEWSSGVHSVLGTDW